MSERKDPWGVERVQVYEAAVRIAIELGDTEDEARDFGLDYLLGRCRERTMLLRAAHAAQFKHLQDTAAENAALKKRVAELEGEPDLRLPPPPLPEMKGE